MELPLKLRLVLSILGLVLGIPTTYYGVVWVQAKAAKQVVNCIEDVYMADFSSQETTLAAQKSFEQCRASVDPKMGTLEFLRQEHKRLSQ